MAEPAIEQPVLRNVDEFIEWVARQDVKYHFLEGTLVMMAGGKQNHSRVALNAGSSLLRQLAGGKCFPCNSDYLVKLDNRTAFYPDVSVSCSEEPDDAMRHPVVLIEVLSDRTESDDRGRKWMLYQRFESLRHYVLLHQDAVCAEHFWRYEPSATWSYEKLDDEAATLELAAIDCSLPLEQLYRGLNLSPPESSIEPPIP